MGVICSPNRSVVFDQSGRLLFSSALENVAVWNVRQSSLACRLREADSGPKDGEVTVIERSPSNKNIIAVGYSSGTIKLFNSLTQKCLMILNGHRKAITTLCFDSATTILASGSKETEIRVWDLINESSLYRLKGHRDVVTDLKFLGDENKYLVSSSKDTLMKVWDLETQHCIQTIVGHRSEVWGFDINKEQTRMISGCHDHQLRLWRIDQTRISSKGAASEELEIVGKRKRVISNGIGDGDDDDDKLIETDNNEEKDFEVIQLIGTISRKTVDRVVRVRYSPDGSMVGCQSADKSFELFRVHTPQEAKQKQRKRRSRRKKKLGQIEAAMGDQKEEKNENEDEKEEEGAQEETEAELLPSDEISPYSITRAPFKIGFFDFSPSEKHFALALNNNQIEVYNYQTEDPKTMYMISLPGHRTDPRALSLSEDGTMLLSTSMDEIKIWNIRSLNCIRTLSSGNGLCGHFINDDRNVIIGTKGGDLELYDINSGECVKKYNAHSGSAVWSICLMKGVGLVSGGADHFIKFWDFSKEPVPGSSVRQLVLVPKEEYGQSDDVLSVKISPNGKLLAAALLDTTVRVFMKDRMRPFLSLYGHKLPVTSMDISSDSRLIITASADKNVKIWGLDFGDCHKSLFAHDDSVMGVQFIPRTHYFFSVGKDGLIKYWDGDKFEQIMKLEGHKQEVWGICVGHQGNTIFTSSHDFSIRVWEETDEQLFLEEEKENAMEQMFESSVEKEAIPTVNDLANEASVTGKKRLETLQAGEQIMEAVELADEERAAEEEYKLVLQKKKAGQSVPRPTPNPLLLGLSGQDYLMKIVKGIRGSDLEDSLLILPFDIVIRFLAYLEKWLAVGREVELSSRIVFFLLKVHHNQLVNNTSVLQTLARLALYSRKGLQSVKDLIGLNMAALQYLSQEAEAQSKFITSEISEKMAAKNKKRPKKIKAF